MGRRSCGGADPREGNEARRRRVIVGIATREMGTSSRDRRMRRIRPKDFREKRFRPKPFRQKPGIVLASIVTLQGNM
jgi:hypothetical protein